MNNSIFKSGFVAIIGKPNVGKSTLLNTLIGEKVAIVSNKAQTTRNKILGIYNENNYQIVFIDTPGIHTPKNKLSQIMNKTISDATKGIDYLIIMIDSTYINDKDYNILSKYESLNIKKLILINKIDLIKKDDILKIIDELKKYNYDTIIPISAINRDGIENLLEQIKSNLQSGPKYFPDDMVTDQPERVLCSEIIREKCLTNLSKEIPHGIGVEILEFKNFENRIIHITANLCCEKQSHKKIIIGNKGSMIRKIGQESRSDIENLLGTHINLQLWVKVCDNWRNKNIELYNLGYIEKD